MRFLTRFAFLLLLPAFVPAEPFPPLTTLSYTGAEPSSWNECASPDVVDGATIRCGAENVRLLGIDGSVLHRCAHCRNRVDSSIASRLSLRQAVSSGPVRYRVLGRDRYGRALAVVRAGSLDLSCWQIRHGRAGYLAGLDKGGIIGRSC